MKIKDNIMKREAGNESKDNNNNEKNIYKSYAYNWKYKKP